MSFSSVFMSCFVYSADIIAVRVGLVSVIVSTVIGYIEKVRLDLVYKYHSNCNCIMLETQKNVTTINFLN